MDTSYTNLDIHVDSMDANGDVTSQTETETGLTPYGGTTSGSATFTTTDTYDSTYVGQVDSETTNNLAGAVTDYGYYASGTNAGYLQTLTVTQGSGTVSASYTYDSAGRVATIASGGNTFTYAYQTNTNLVSSVTEVTGSGTSAVTIVTSYTYDAHSQQLTGDTVTSTAGTNSAKVVGSGAYVYNANYQMSSSTNVTASVSTHATSAASYHYAYDAQDQIDDDYGSGWAGSYADWYYYDGAGNEDGYDSFNALNQDTSYTYDARGNETDDGNQSYTWDSANRLVAVTPDYPSAGTPLMTFGYDSQGRRIWKAEYAWNSSLNGGAGGWNALPGQVTTFAYDGSNLVAEYDSAGHIQRSYTWDPTSGRLLTMTDHVSGTTYLAVYDGSGNISELVNAGTGVVAERYQFSAYGDTLLAQGSVFCPFAYGGGYYDPETGLVYLQARYYDPAQQRFLSRDPSGESSDVNLYRYAGNDPINKQDRSGLAPDPDWSIDIDAAVAANVKARGALVPPANAAEKATQDGVLLLLRNQMRLLSIEASNRAALHYDIAQGKRKDPRIPPHSADENMAAYKYWSEKAADLDRWGVHGQEIGAAAMAQQEVKVQEAIAALAIVHLSTLGIVPGVVSKTRTVDESSLVSAEGTPLKKVGAGRAVNIYGEGETGGFENFATEEAHADGRPMTSLLADRSASDIALRDAPLSPATISEMQRIAQPGARITYSNAAVSNFAKYVEQIEGAFPGSVVITKGTKTSADGLTRAFIVIELPK